MKLSVLGSIDSPLLLPSTQHARENLHVSINFIIDRKAAIDIIENIPTKYKEKNSFYFTYTI